MHIYIHTVLTVAAILFGWLFTVATAWSLGEMALSRLPVNFYRWEQRLFAFILGSACLSAIVFGLCAARLAWKPIFLIMGFTIIGYALWSGAYRSRGESFPPLSQLWYSVFLLAFAAFTYLYFFNALAPETSPDGVSYHLGFVAKYQRAHGFVPITTSVYANLPEGMELLFLCAFEFGRHSAAALVHFTFLLALAFQILCYGRRIGHPVVGVAGSILTYASPVVGMDGSVAYNDVGVAAVLFAVFYLLQIWDQERSAKLLVPIGILAGFSCAVKYTAFVAVPYAVGFVAWKLWRARKPVLRPVLVVSLFAAALILPWMVKNWIEVANPVSPFANRLFPNPYVHVQFEEDYRKIMRTYALHSYWDLPVQIAVRGNLTAGFIGPLFLLAPLGFLALRFRPGRQVLLAAFIFGLPYPANVGTRFLISAVPFISLALALALSNIRWLVLILTGAHAIASWPGVDDLYCSRDAWRMQGVSPRAGLRVEPEDVYLSQHSDFGVARMIEHSVPEDAKVFTFSTAPRAYTKRELLNGYESAFSQVLRDVLWTPLVHDFQPTRVLKFVFPERDLRRLRITQKLDLPGMQWSVSELRVFSRGSEIARDPAWRLTARPNPWEVQLAFDNSLATRWRSWQPAEPGMYLQVDFGRMQNVDTVVVETSGDNAATKMEVNGLGGPDRSWVTLAANPEESLRQIRASLRQAATAELKARGIRYVLVADDDAGAADFRMYAHFWGMKRVGEWREARLYYIE